ncbi:MAG: MerR family transcriptional regulator [Candidatus Cloacimonadaceae bacterium]|jgi:DNA-binding transcriptional MerR regulator|nr:MerR family transcriptional regulator [Candidatus Cloacimonadota bacterium]MDD3524624.1 MerR family transcriptional regulator [Candidatus Cloacimonadota bacterium]MDY0319138.1 MerR family transcriptional regulator [Candidatus Cloacimonadaceae bacterium]
MTKLYYSIGEVSNLLDVKPHVLRYWETEIPAIRPKKSGHKRRYNLQQIETLKKIKDMLYNQRYTIEGARQKLKQDKDIRQDAKLEAIAKEKLQVSVALPAIATELLELRKGLLDLKQKCRKITGK